MNCGRDTSWRVTDVPLNPFPFFLEPFFCCERVVFAAFQLFTASRPQPPPPAATPQPQARTLQVTRNMAQGIRNDSVFIPPDLQQSQRALFTTFRADGAACNGPSVGNLRPPRPFGFMSFLGRGSYFVAAAAGVASAFYIFQPELIEIKRQREASGQSPAPLSAQDSTAASAASASAPPAAGGTSTGTWQELKARDGRVYWMNTDTGVARASCAMRALLRLIALWASPFTCSRLVAGKGSWTKPSQ